MAAHAPQLPQNAGKIVSSFMATVGAVGGAGEVAYRFTYDSGWTYEYDAGGDLLRAYTSGAVGSGASTVSTSTGVNPTETQYSLYGHTVPLSVLGLARIGGEIIAGPWVDNGNATFCISFGVPADPSGTRTLREIAFDSEVVWTAADGFSAEGFTYRWYSGTLTQAADPIEVSHYGADAVAYRPQMLIWFQDLPLANTKFQKIPYVAALIADSVGDMINLGEGFTRLAESPWVGYTSAQFETSGVTDACGGMIFAQDTDFLSAIQMFGRFYKSWDILQTDKLRIVDRGAATTADINLDRTRLMSELSFGRAETSSVPRVLELSTIDPDADYTIVPSKAVRPLVPVTVTTSVSTESVFLPVIMDSGTRQSLVTYAKYQEEVARRRITGTAMMYGLEIEPGDLVAFLDLGDDFINEVFHIIETTHGQNYAVEFVGESILRCSLVVDDSTDPYWIYVVLLMGFEDIDGATGSPGFDDESLKHHGTATTIGTVIDTAERKFGLASGNMNGGSAIFGATIPWEDSDWWLSKANSDQFTVECWIRFSSFGTFFIASKYLQMSWEFTSVIGSPNELAFSFTPYTDGSSWTSLVTTTTGGASLTTGIWYHVAVDKDSTGTIRIYVNGVPKASSTPANSKFMYDPYGGDLNLAANVWIDELRITKGIARYHTDAGFTPPTSAFPRGGPL